MKNYRLGLNHGGRVQFVLDVFAKDLRSAAKEWARLTSHNDCLYDEKKRTYFGWPVVKTKLPALQRKQEIGM